MLPIAAAGARPSGGWCPSGRSSDVVGPLHDHRDRDAVAGLSASAGASGFWLVTVPAVVGRPAAPSLTLDVEAGRRRSSASAASCGLADHVRHLARLPLEILTVIVVPGSTAARRPWSTLERPRPAGASLSTSSKSRLELQAVEPASAAAPARGADRGRWAPVTVLGPAHRPDGRPAGLRSTCVPAAGFCSATVSFVQSVVATGSPRDRRCRLGRRASAAPRPPVRPITARHRRPFCRGCCRSEQRRPTSATTASTPSAASAAITQADVLRRRRVADRGPAGRAVGALRLAASRPRPSASSRPRSSPAWPGPGGRRRRAARRRASRRRSGSG